MGYRSQVRCLIYGPPDKLNAMVVKHQLEGGQVFDSWFKDDIRRYKATRSIFNAEKTRATPKDARGMHRAVWDKVEVEVLDLQGDDWKWYDGYEDVQAWEAFMHSAEEWDCSYEFVRIGEEPSDIEVNQNIVDGGDIWLGAQSSIYCYLQEEG